MNSNAGIGSRVFKSVMVLALAITSTSIWSACSMQTNDGSAYFKYVVSGFKPPEFNPNVAKGTVLYSAILGAIRSNGRANNLVICVPTITGYYAGKHSSIDNNIYPTAVKGVGMRLNNGAVPTSTRQYFKNTGSFGSFAYYYLDVKIDLVKTEEGDITAGGVLDNDFMYERVENEDGQIIAQFNFASPVVLRPKVPTCTAESPDPVPLPSAVIHQFNSIGSTSAPRSFRISLVCKGGNPGSLTKAFVTLTDVANPGNFSNVLSLTKTSVAKGVGVQIRKDDEILGFGPDSSAIGNRNQWFAAAIPQGQERLDIPLTARYVQTEETVTKGSANASATFTISYQ